MTKREVDDAEMELEVRSMTIKSMKSELDLMGVSLLGLAEKEDLIDALLRARRKCTTTILKFKCYTNIPILIFDIVKHKWQLMLHQ